ncbi:MAG: hypothetical protein L7H18_04835 [Candidatus Nealsonbacteria bacterium DGGOD1a]|jgi:REP element-mobilizing transposase RayT|nr:MAG: hypothetical protein L7H18_04835 [Candidatus Nealsonbacteria bacterium DGGOD1a]
MYDSEIHHRRTIRVKGYDYSQDGAYFVTVCAQNRQCLFGSIADAKMELNKAGEIVNNCWYEIPKHYPFVILDEFVVMPNHFHGIIIIQNREWKRERANNHSPLQMQNAGTSKTVGAIIRGYKIGVTKLLGKPIWQRNYYEHIIRNDDDLDRVREYIINNPLNWEIDELYSRIP